VPHIARARRVTRQRIQTLVNPLLGMELAESISNPASKRSPLIRLTKTGAQTILEMRRREGREMQVAVCETRILQAAQTLAELRSALEN
jgi:DNA-binding MarR family transcriptional regulator